MHPAVLDLYHPGLAAELLAPDPVGKHADAGPQRGEAELVQFHVDDLHLQHVAGLRAADLDRSGRAVDKGKGDIGLGQLLPEMADRAIVGIDRAFHHEGFTWIDAGNVAIVPGQRVFDIINLADALGHVHSRSY